MFEPKTKLWRRIFHGQGVKANALFMHRKPAAEAPWTQRVWIYDFRTNIAFTLKQNPSTYDYAASVPWRSDLGYAFCFT